MKRKEKQCLKIQWGKLFTINGKPACPDCHKEAENILGFWGTSCWAHKINKK